MSEASFSRVEKTENRLYGPRKLLVCGYPAAEQAAVGAILTAMKVEDLPVVFASVDHLEWSVQAVLDLPGGTGRGQDSSTRRAVVMSGVTEKELHMLMAGYRSLELPAQLWATVTPVSESWLLKDLLEELAAEREAMLRQQALKQKKAP